MSDSDGLDLAGVIGTWVAAFLAIVALVGVLPVFLLYRRSKTEKAKALALLDDPSGNYVINKFKLANLRYLKVGRLTNLASPPNMETLEYEPQWRSQVQNESTGGWINFSYIINAAFPNRDSTATGDEKNLHFEDGETFLLVHRAWILVLAVVHCYAYRQDYGLPKENASQDHIQNLPWNKTLAGLSGGLFQHTSDIYDREERGKLTFIMHPRSTPSVLEGRADIRALVLLSFGFVKMTDGNYLRFTVGDSDLSRGRGSRHVKVAQLVDHNADSIDTRLFSDMKLQVGKTKTINVVEPRTVFPNHRAKLDASFMKTKNYMNLGRFKPLSNGDNVWIHREDVYRISAGYLSTPFRRQGFLYANYKDLIVSKLFSAKPTTMTLRWGQKWVSKLNVKEDERRVLNIALEKLSNFDLEDTSWSREAMQNLYDLDQAILVACASSDWKFRSVSVLFVCETRFRANFNSNMECEEDEQPQFVRLSIPNQKVVLGRSKEVGDQQEAAFHFAFMSVFAFQRPPTDGESEDLPIAQAVFAAIQGQIRAIMWKMSLSPHGVHDFVDDNIYYVSTRPLRRAQVPTRVRRRSRSSPSSESSSASSSDVDEVSESEPEILPLGRVVVPRRRARSRSEDSIEYPTSHEPKSETLVRDEMPLHTAARQGDEAGVQQWIERGSNKNAKNSDGETALFLAAKNGDLLLVKYLESIGVDLEVRDATDTTALSIAAMKGQLSVVRFLLDKGADSEVRDNSGSRALTWAAYEGEKSVVEVLLQHGSDKDAQDDKGRTPLYDACYAKHWEVAEVLLHNGADCNKTTYIGNAPLHEATEHGKTSIVQLLLQKGADTSRRNSEGKTALQIAVWKNHEAICRLLEDWKNKERENQDVDGGRENNLESPSLLEEKNPGKAHDLP